MIVFKKINVAINRLKQHVQRTNIGLNAIPAVKTIALSLLDVQHVRHHHLVRRDVNITVRQ